MWKIGVLRITYHLVEVRCSLKICELLRDDVNGRQYAQQTGPDAIRLRPRATLPLDPRRLRVSDASLLEPQTRRSEVRLVGIQLRVQ